MQKSLFVICRLICALLCLSACNSAPQKGDDTDAPHNFDLDVTYFGEVIELKNPQSVEALLLELASRSTDTMVDGKISTDEIENTYFHNGIVATLTYTTPIKAEHENAKPEKVIILDNIVNSSAFLIVITNENAITYSMLPEEVEALRESLGVYVLS